MINLPPPTHSDFDRRDAARGYRVLRGRFLSPSRGEEEGQRTKGTQRGIPGEINTASEGPRVSRGAEREREDNGRARSVGPLVAGF